jgi:PAS domain S-box-containing protein
MISAPLRPNEDASLAALRDLDVLDSDTEAPFDALVQAAAAVCGVPISLISLIDSERQWFKAALGLPGVTETPRDLAFCAHAVLGDELFEVPDALQDERFRDNPLVVEAPHIRFYAGVPLELGPGLKLGTLCVIDRQPRQLDELQREVLRQLALAATQMLAGRRALRRQQAANQALDARMRDLRQIVDAVPSMLGYWHPDLTCRFVNRAYAAWFGVEPDAMVGCHISQLLGPAIYELNRPRLEAALSGEPQVFERDVLGPDGRVRHALAHYQPDVVNGVVVGILVEVNDVTSLKEAEARASALQDENKRLAMVARSTSNAIAIVGADLRISWVNAGFERMTGYSAEEAIGRLPTELLLCEDSDPDTVQRLGQAIRAGQSCTCEMLNRSKSGRLFWAKKDLQPLHDDAGELAGFVSIESDITDRVRATEAAEQASRAKSDFIATISHELRTPLQSIIGFSELGKHRAQGAGQHRFASMFDMVLGGGHRMLSLVNDLLDLSAIDAASVSLVRERVDLGVLALQVCEELGSVSGARGVRIESAASLPAMPADGDGRRLQQVIRNLLANAVRFAPAGSIVTLAGADLGPRGIELAVRDHGPGIPPDELEAVFEPFVQSSRTRDGSGGTGLGLTICRRIMGAHGGRVTASNPTDGGAEMRLWLPAVHGDDPARAGAAQI